MKRYSPLVISAAILLMVAACQPPASQVAAPEIEFTLTMEEPASHYLGVQMTIGDWSGDSLVLKMPVWTPGYYKVLDLAQNVVGFTAEASDGTELKAWKSRKNGWTIDTKGISQIQVNYYVFANRRSVADPLLDTVKAFISPTGVFMHPEGLLSTPVSVIVDPWDGWERISTGLDQVDGNPWHLSAGDYDELYDCPILVGNFTTKTFEVEGILHEIAIERVENADLDLLASDLSRIVNAGKNLIGEFPYTHYSFLCMEKGMGGLEHRNSMAVYSDISDYPGEHPGTGWLGFMAHEYFHLYNVKTIRPYVLGPFDYDRENLTTMLWVSEGGTVYYQEVILNRAGYKSAPEFLQTMSRIIAGYENQAGHLFQSATQSSWDTWINFFSRNENSRDVTISYYDKGAILCMLVDLAIRHESGNSKSLDDVMRTLYYDYHKAENRGFTDAEFRAECEKAAGANLTELFEEIIPGTGKVDYNKYLAYAGLQIDTTATGEVKTYLGRSFTPRRWFISPMPNPTDQQKSVYTKWLQ